MPAFNGISHVDLSVTDLDRSIDFYTRVLDQPQAFRGANEAEGFEVAYLMGGSAILGLVRHAHTEAGPFTPRRIGLDHLSFGVANRAALVEWASRLDELGVAHNGVEDQAFGAGLTFADPDGTALEFYWLNLPSAAPQN